MGVDILGSYDSLKDDECYPFVYHERNSNLDEEEYVDYMEFRLVYEGPLPSSGNSARHTKEKHNIRKVIHEQLSELWQTDNLLKLVSTRLVRSPGGTAVQILGRKFQKCGYQFVPLVNQEFGLERFSKGFDLWSAATGRRF